METVYHAADHRGKADHGWLKSRHSFSFGKYYDPSRIHFGALRVLNDDIVAGGRGFGMHRHENMEIISIPLSGSLEHADSLGNISVIRSGDVQLMSAGTGIAHSEYNKQADAPVHFLQLWIIPDRQGVTPRYDQIHMTEAEGVYQIASPDPADAGVWMHQQAWMSRGHYRSPAATSYRLHRADHGVYLFLISGELQIADRELQARDALGVWNTDTIEISVGASADYVLIEVPMIEL